MLIIPHILSFLAYWTRNFNTLPKNDEIFKLDNEGNYGYLFEIDIAYPRELHAATSDFSLGPESDFATEGMFSPFVKSYYASLCDARSDSNEYDAHRRLLLAQYDKQSMHVTSRFENVIFGWG